MTSSTWRDEEYAFGARGVCILVAGTGVHIVQGRIESFDEGLKATMKDLK